MSQPTLSASPVRAGPRASAQPDAADAVEAIEAAGLWLARLDLASGQIVWSSRALARRFAQWTPGRPVAALEAAFGGLRDALSAPADPAGEASRIATPDGGTLLVTVRPLAATEVTVWLRDAGTESEAAARHLEDRERLLFVSRSLSVGEMASTLAHELNQPIGSIVNLLRGLSLRIERGAVDPRVLGPAIAQGVDQAMYAAGILARVREYVQPRRPRRETVHLPTLVSAAIALLDWEIGRDQVAVHVVDRSGSPTPVVLGDPVMLQQVVVNLVRNGIEAMRGVPPDERRLDVLTERDDDSVVLRIADRGCGLDADASRRLFTPFFTTKPEGTGLGLHVCRSIVELHEGRLWFDARDGRGCTVCVSLPVSADAPTGVPIGEAPR
jgi:two-component system sensor kinase FixL